MKVTEIMTHDVEIASPNDSLQTIANKMKDRDIGFLPVYEGDQLTGVLTDRDLTLRAMANGTNPHSVIGRDIVTSPAIYCYDDQDVEEAAQLMQYNQIRRLVVLDRRDDRLAGVISLGDLASIADENIAGKVLHLVTIRVMSL